jgi:hypothetical protein
VVAARVRFSAQKPWHVSCTGNKITGANSALIYNTAFGETESNNTCANGLFD